MLVGELKTRKELPYSSQLWPPPLQHTWGQELDSWNSDFLPTLQLPTEKTPSSQKCPGYPAMGSHSLQHPGSGVRMAGEGYSGVCWLLLFPAVPQRKDLELTFLALPLSQVDKPVTELGGWSTKQIPLHTSFCQSPLPPSSHRLLERSGRGVLLQRLSSHIRSLAFIYLQHCSLWYTATLPGLPKGWQDMLLSQIKINPKALFRCRLACLKPCELVVLEPSLILVVISVVCSWLEWKQLVFCIPTPFSPFWTRSGLVFNGVNHTWKAPLRFWAEPVVRSQEGGWRTIKVTYWRANRATLPLDEVSVVLNQFESKNTTFFISPSNEDYKLSQHRGTGLSPPSTHVATLRGRGTKQYSY